MKPEYLALLKEINSDKVPHERGTLYDHLTGTYNYLASWQSEEYVCSAGLFHSIYGTTIFHHQSISYADRKRMKNLIGEKTEDLVYIFSTVNRPSAFIAAIREGHIIDVVSQAKMPISRQKLGELIEIEVANLLEQGGGRLFFGQLKREVSQNNFLLREPILSVIQKI